MPADRDQTFRVAIRKFAPFESAIEQAVRRFPGGAPIGVSALERGVARPQPALRDAVHARRAEGRRRGTSPSSSPTGSPRPWPRARCSTWRRECARQPVPDYPHGWAPSLTRLQQFGDADLRPALPRRPGVPGLPHATSSPTPRSRPPSPSDTAIRWPFRAPGTQFADVARFFTRPEDGQYGTIFAGFPDGHNTVYDFCLQLWSRGGELTRRRAATPTLDTPAAVAALDFYRRLVNDRTAHTAGAGGDRLGQERRALRRRRDRDDGQLVRLRRRLRTARCPVKGKVDVATLPAGPGGRSRLAQRLLAARRRRRQPPPGRGVRLHPPLLQPGHGQAD